MLIFFFCQKEPAQPVSPAQMIQDMKNAANREGGERKFPSICISNEEKFSDISKNPH